MASTPQQVLASLLHSAHWVCKQMPDNRRLQRHLLQLLELALELTACAGTTPEWQAPSPAAGGPPFGTHSHPRPVPPPAAAAAAQTPGREPQWEPQWATAPQGGPSVTGSPQTFAPPAPAGPHLCDRCRLPLRARRVAKKTFLSSSKTSRGRHDPQAFAGSSAAQHSRPDEQPAAASSSTPDGLDSSPPTTPTPTASAPPPAASRSAVGEAELLDLPGLSRQQARTFAAAVHALDSRYEAVQTAAVQRLQGITAEWPNPAAVGDALLEVGAISMLAALLRRDSTCHAAAAAAAATLCNIGWFQGPRAAILAAGAIPMLLAMLWDEQQTCQVEAAYALVALTSSHDEATCAAVAAVGGIPRLVGLLQSTTHAASSGNPDRAAEASDGCQPYSTHTNPTSRGDEADDTGNSSTSTTTTSSSSSWVNVGGDSESNPPHKTSNNPEASPCPPDWTPAGDKSAGAEAAPADSPAAEAAASVNVAPVDGAAADGVRPFSAAGDDRPLHAAEADGNRPAEHDAAANQAEGTATAPCRPREAPAAADDSPVEPAAAGHKYKESVAGCTACVPQENLGQAAEADNDRLAEPDAAAASGPDKSAAGRTACREEAVAAVRVLGHLAAGSTTRRAIITSTGNALQHVTACPRSTDPACRAAALQALQEITRTQPWRLSDTVVVQQVKATGVLEVLEELVHQLRAEGSGDYCEIWEVLRLQQQLRAPAQPWIAPQQGSRYLTETQWSS